jgi:ABC-type polysaccharide/polyol phosphate export permease
MGKLSELVRRDYDAEVEIIRKARGNLWLIGSMAAFFLAVMWVFDEFFRKPWTQSEIGYAMIAVVAYPFITRAWERYKVAAQMRHQREVRIETKLHALLGLVNIEDV